MHIVDEIFADEIEAMDGFEAYHALDCGGGEIVSISLLRDQAIAEASHEWALEFVRRELGGFDIERTEVIGGKVVVGRGWLPMPPGRVGRERVTQLRYRCHGHHLRGDLDGEPRGVDGCE
jgi:hypothetical protein